MGGATDRRALEMPCGPPGVPSTVVWCRLAGRFHPEGVGYLVVIAGTFEHNPCVHVTMSPYTA